MSLLKEILSIFEEKKIPKRNKQQTKEYKHLKKEYEELLIKYNYLAKRFKEDKERIEKTKYLCAILRPLMEKVEKQNIDAVNAFLSQPPIRNLF